MINRDRSSARKRRPGIQQTAFVILNEARMSISLETVRDLAGQLSPRDQVRLITLLSAQLETVVTDAPAPSSMEAWTTYDQLRAEFAALPEPPTSAVAELSASRR